MPRLIYKPKASLIQFPSLWLPGSPLPSSRGLARRCCCEGGCELCEFCSTGTGALSWEFTVSGVVDDNCSDCASGNATYPNGVNDTWIVEEFEFFAAPSFLCRWTYTLTDPFCDITTVHVHLRNPVVPNNFMTLDVRFTESGLFGATVLLYGTTFTAEQISCNTIVDLPLPITSWGSQCDPAGSTCIVTGRCP